MPVGSFESAGIAVFVRAHEGRRKAGASVLPSANGLDFSPVATRVTIGSSDSTGHLQVEMPTVADSAGRSSWVSLADQPLRPGALLPGDTVEILAPFARSGLLEARRTPDLELEVSKRATLGVFGEANTIEATDIRNATARTKRDLGAGVTLQYRFAE